MTLTVVQRHDAGRARIAVIGFIIVPLRGVFINPPELFGADSRLTLMRSDAEVTRCGVSCYPKDNCQVERSSWSTPS